MKKAVLTLNQKGGGRHIGSHEGFFFFWGGGGMHSTTKRKKGDRSCFEEALDSFGLEAKRRRRPRKRHLVHSERERRIRIKCKRPTGAGRSDGGSVSSSKELETTLFFPKGFEIEQKQRKRQDLH